MIAKRIMSKRGQGFRKLAAYLLVVKGDADPASWTRLGLVCADPEQETGKLAWARVSNCRTTDPGWAAKEIIATQARNTRAKADKSYHLVASWPLGEAPTRAQMEAAEDRLVAALGFDGHQRIAAAHRDRDHVHLHIAINRIAPDTYHAIHPFRDHFRLQAACVELEAEHGFARGAHSRDPQEAARNRERRTQARAAAALTDPAHEAFRRQRASALRDRDAALKALKARQVQYARRLSAWHSERLREEKVLALRGHMRRDGFAHLADQRRKDRTERLAREAKEREAVLGAYPIPQWADFRPNAPVLPPKVQQQHRQAQRVRPGPRQPAQQQGEHQR